MVKGVRTGSLSLVGLALLGVAAQAAASPGNGIRMGGSSGRLHPYLELETRWDSNVAYSDQGKATSGYVLHVRPGLVMEAPGDRATLDLHASLDWAQYLGRSSDLSRLYGEAQLGLGVNRKGTVGLEVTDAFQRSSSTQVLNFGGALVSNTNKLDVAVPFRPGGGAFVTTLRGGWALETYEPFVSGRLCAANTPACDPAEVSKLGYSDLSAGLDLRWKFLPRTAAVLQGEYWTRLPSSSLGAKASGFRAWTGLAGLFTAHLAGTIKGGWGAAYNTPGSISSWLANVEGEWLPFETAGVKAGYVRDVGADPGQDGGYTSHRLYAGGHVLLSGRYTAAADGSFEYRAYPRSPVQAAELFTFGPSVEAELARWLRVGAGYAYTKRTSQVASGTPALPGFRFDKSEVYLRIRGTY
jgi:hypothetical protein